MSRTTAPKHLAKHGRNLYRSIVREYAVDDAAGLALLTTACECLDRVRAAQEKIAEHGEVVTDRYGSLKAHPAVGMAGTGGNAAGVVSRHAGRV